MSSTKKISKKTTLKQATESNERGLSKSEKLKRKHPPRITNDLSLSDLSIDDPYTFHLVSFLSDKRKDFAIVDSSKIDINPLNTKFGLVKHLGKSFHVEIQKSGNY